MNNVFTAKLLQNLQAKKKGNKGFTLIELLVVVIIIGVLAAIALPNLLSQVAKGRQSEAKNNLGAINRTQQAERLATASFQPLANLPVKVTGTNYDYADDGTPDAVQGSQTATAKTLYENDVLDYTAAVNQQTDGTFAGIICQSDVLDGATAAITATAGTTTAAPTCGTGSTAL
jgi:type IV pilus assembly protein PilA